ncbi:MAG: hypothetical protein JWO72_3232 [Caulobacteraceae bacterium]|nr:hypothetical protein [Caulobacteraceae bacterium]
MITRIRQRRARGRLFAISARQIALAAAIVLGAAIGFGLLTERANTGPVWFQSLPGR